MYVDGGRYHTCALLDNKSLKVSRSRRCPMQDTLRALLEDTRIARTDALSPPRPPPGDPFDTQCVRVMESPSTDCLATFESVSVTQCPRAS